jgi:transcriptional regulator with XRE-family HTH domain
MLDQTYNEIAQSPGERLRRARIRAGWHKAKPFADEVGVNYSSYHRHESGRSPLTPENATLYAKALNITPAELLYGDELRKAPPVPIVGVIGAGGKIVAMDVLEHTTLATSLDLIGHVVHGNDLYPGIRHGDVVFCRPLKPSRFDPSAVHGQECICQLADGSMILRQVIIQRDGRATLLATNAQTPTPPLTNVDLIAAEPVEMIRRRRAPV